MRTIPYRVKSKNHESVSATGNPSTISTTNETNRPIWNVEYRKNLRDALSQRPAAHNIRDCDAIHSSSLQLGKKVSAFTGRSGWQQASYLLPVGNGKL